MVLLLFQRRADRLRWWHRRFLILHVAANYPRLDVHFRENGFFVVDGRKARILVMEKDIMKVFVELDGEWSLKKQVQSYRW